MLRYWEPLATSILRTSNESKCICFSAFSLLVIWVAFIPTYIATQARQEIQNSFIACAVAVSAFAILICFFSPKVVVIFFWRERNSKHYSRRRVGSDKYDVNPHGSMLTTTTSALEMSYTGNSAIAERQEPGTAQYQILLQMIINPLLHNYLYISNVFDACIPLACIWTLLICILEIDTLMGWALASFPGSSTCTH